MMGRGRGAAGEIFATMLLHFVIPFNLICNIALFAKSWIMTFWPLEWWGANIFYHVAAFHDFISNWYATWPCSKKVEFRPIDPIPRFEGGRGYADKIFAIKLLRFMILFNLMCNMTSFWHSWLLTYWPHSQGRGGGWGICRQNIRYQVAAFRYSL